MLNLEMHSEEMEFTDAIVSAIEKKMSVLEKYLASAGTPQKFKLVVGKTTNHHSKGPVFKAEADVLIPGHKLHAEAVGEDLYASIDVLKDELKRQLVKTVQSAIGSHRDGAREAKERGTETELV